MDSIEHRTLNVNSINMHVAIKGDGPRTILFVHGFPELWYSWRHQILGLSSLGYRCVAPDLRGFGDTDAPDGVEKYTILHIVGDLVALLDALAPGEKVFVAGHDWGAYVAWHLSLYRPDKVKALVNLSVAYAPRNPAGKPVDMMRHVYGDDYYFCRFQEPGIEEELAEVGTKRVFENFISHRTPAPLFLPKGELFGNPLEKLPDWISEEDLSLYVSKYEKTGFSGGLNYYRVINLNWELNAAWTGSPVTVPTKFIVGDLDTVYNSLGAKQYVNSPLIKKFVPLLEEIVVMQGAGHWIQQEKAEEVTNHIAHFFQKF